MHCISVVSVHEFGERSGNALVFSTTLLLFLTDEENSRPKKYLYDQRLSIVPSFELVLHTVTSSVFDRVERRALPGLGSLSTASLSVAVWAGSACFSSSFAAHDCQLFSPAPSTDHPHRECAFSATVCTNARLPSGDPSLTALLRGGTPFHRPYLKRSFASTSCKASKRMSTNTWRSPAGIGNRAISAITNIPFSLTTHGHFLLHTKLLLTPDPIPLSPLSPLSPSPPSPPLPPLPLSLQHLTTVTLFRVIHPFSLFSGPTTITPNTHCDRSHQLL